jgi:hypothetical protein
MTHEATTGEKAGALCGIARFAARAGLPLPSVLVVPVPGDDTTALARFASAERLLAGTGVTFTREDTTYCHRLIVQAGAGVSYILLHERQGRRS